MAARSLQAEFDDAVAALQLATHALSASRQQLAAVTAAAAGKGAAEDVLAVVQQVLAEGSGSGSGSGSSGDVEGDLLPALQARLAEWQQRVVSHQDPSRLLRWAGSGAGGGGTGGASAD